jgi:hypothetical protein
VFVVIRPRKDLMAIPKTITTTYWPVVLATAGPVPSVETKSLGSGHHRSGGHADLVRCLVSANSSEAGLCTGGH